MARKNDERMKWVRSSNGDMKTPAHAGNGLVLREWYSFLVEGLTFTHNKAYSTR